MIATPRQKSALIEAAGLDAMLTLPFTREFADLSAETFVRDHLAGGLGTRAVFVGANFNFGRDREGDAALLVRLCTALGIEADTVGAVLYLGSPISSSRIRRAILAGEVELAGALLGRPYAIEGTVVHGESRGAALGFPTANLAPRNALIPQDGVYVSEAVIDGAAHPSVTNIGTRPTFSDSAYAIETHVLDGPGDLYEREIAIRFHARLRQELKFPSTQALVEQVGRDIERARAFFRNGRRLDGA